MRRKNALKYKPNPAFPYYIMKRWSIQTAQINSLFEALCSEAEPGQWKYLVRAFGKLVGVNEVNSRHENTTKPILETSAELASFLSALPDNLYQLQFDLFSHQSDYLKPRDVLRSLYSLIVLDCLDNRKYESDKQLLLELDSATEKLILIELNASPNNARDAESIIAFAKNG